MDPNPDHAAFQTLVERELANMIANKRHELQEATTRMLVVQGQLDQLLTVRGAYERVAAKVVKS